jgi:hypothetical protein
MLALRTSASGNLWCDQEFKFVASSQVTLMLLITDPNKARKPDVDRWWL